MIALLVVEDHALVREGLVLALRQLEADTVVYEASDANGASALLAKGNVYDLILLDLGLPGIDGLSFLATLRKRYPMQPVVILSAFDDPHTIDKALQSGAAGFVPKSFSSERLLEAVREVLAGNVFRPGRPDLAALTPRRARRFIATPSPRISA